MSIFSLWGISLHNVWIHNADHPFFSEHRLQRGEVGCLVEIFCNFTSTTGGHFFWNTNILFKVAVEGLPSTMHSFMMYVSLEWISFLNGYQFTTSLDLHSRKNRHFTIGARFKLTYSLCTHLQFDLLHLWFSCSESTARFRPCLAASYSVFPNTN